MVESEDICCEEERIRHLNERNEMGLSMVLIRESNDDLAIFPPINHENLYIDSDRESPSESSSPFSDSSSSSSFSPSDSDTQFKLDRKPQYQPSETVGKPQCYYSLLRLDIIQCWWKLLLGRLLPKFQIFVTCFSSNCLCSFSRTLRSFYPIIGIVIWWWLRNRTRTRRRIGEGEIVDHLRYTIKERDERITQLLHQIAQMNELLVKKLHSN